MQLQIPEPLYWRWRVAAAERRAIVLDNQLRLQKAEAAFQATCQAIAAAVPDFALDGTYKPDDSNCTVTAVTA